MADKYADLEIPLVEYRDLPAGTYSLGVLVTPAGRTDSSYLWRTDVTLD
jgi:hypothetical protein